MPIYVREKIFKKPRKNYKKITKIQKKIEKPQKVRNRENCTITQY